MMFGSAKKFPSEVVCATVTMLPFMNCASEEQAQSLSVKIWNGEFCLATTWKLTTNTVVAEDTSTVHPLKVVTAALTIPTASLELSMTGKTLHPDPAKGPEKSTLIACTPLPLYCS